MCYKQTKARKTFIDLIQHRMIYKQELPLWLKFYTSWWFHHLLLYWLAMILVKCWCWYLRQHLIHINPGLRDDCFTTAPIWSDLFPASCSLTVTHSTNFPESCFAGTILCTHNKHYFAHPTLCTYNIQHCAHYFAHTTMHTTLHIEQTLLCTSNNVHIAHNQLNTHE